MDDNAKQLGKLNYKPKEVDLLADPNFRVVADDANDGIVIATSAQDPYVYANPRTSDLSGYTVFELLRMRPPQLLPSEGCSQIRGSEKIRQSGAEVLERYKTEIAHKAGYRVPVEVYKTKTTWMGETADLILLRDIAALKKTEAVQAVSQIQKYRSEKYQAKELLRAAGKAERRNSDVLKYRIDLERANRELARTNIALSVLARSIDKKSTELEDGIANYIRSKILPLIEDMCRDHISDLMRAKLQVLAAYLENLTPSVSKNLEIVSKVSPKELRIAALINKDYKTDEIARFLNLSPHTVKTHRRSIRKKLSIRNTKVNLTSFLKLKLGAY